MERGNEPRFRVGDWRDDAISVAGNQNERVNPDGVDHDGRDDSVGDEQDCVSQKSASSCCGNEANAINPFYLNASKISRPPKIGLNQDPLLVGTPPTLRSRIVERVPCAGKLNSRDDERKVQTKCVFYFPTVVLRKKHNAAFALACRIANKLSLPLIVLCTVLDDSHIPNCKGSSRSREGDIDTVSFTARRLAFTLQALQSACSQWEAHGAGVAIRVHLDSRSRVPHHLTLIARCAAAVVLDEGFTDPYRAYNNRITKACLASSTTCYSVDSSTCVPICSKLRYQGVSKTTGEVRFSNGVNRAWKWKARVESELDRHISGAVRLGHLLPQPLSVRLPKDFFLDESFGDRHNEKAEVVPWASKIRSAMPSGWGDFETPSPGQRPWTVAELLDTGDIAKWIMSCTWSGVDKSVAPCTQTIGSEKAGLRRWNTFLDCSLRDYHRKRNFATDPHAVSRMSCYLNMGVVSVFDIVSDVLLAKALDIKNSMGCERFLDQIFKWREFSYMLTLSDTAYHSAGSILPTWAQDFWKRRLEHGKSSKSDGGTRAYSTQHLATGLTDDDKWNAMQRYLVESGELHNNPRMTWAKTAIFWQTTAHSADEVLHQLMFLNDRYALDGLSPPSYAGILWCFGWSDNPRPSRGVREKWSKDYGISASKFEEAMRKLRLGYTATDKSEASGKKRSRQTTLSWNALG